MKAGEPGLRERKKARTRERLIETALRQFTEKGYDAVSIDAIAGAVEVSRRTFFRYFSSKEDVVLSWLEKTEKALLADLASRPREEPPLAALRAVFVRNASLYGNDRKRMRALVRLFGEVSSVRSLYEGREQALEQSVAEEIRRRMGRQAKGGLAARLIAAIAFSAKRAAFEQWVAEGCRPNLAALTEEAFLSLQKTVDSAS